MIIFLFICYLFTLVLYKLPWGKSVARGKAVKMMKVQLHV